MSETDGSPWLVCPECGTSKPPRMVNNPDIQETCPACDTLMDHHSIHPWIAHSRQLGEEISQLRAKCAALKRDWLDLVDDRDRFEHQRDKAIEALMSIISTDADWWWLEDQRYDSRPNMRDDRMAAYDAFTAAIKRARALLAKEGV